VLVLLTDQPFARPIYGVRPFISEPPHRFKRVALSPILAAACANTKFEWWQEVIGAVVALFALNRGDLRPEFYRFLPDLLATLVLVNRVAGRCRCWWSGSGAGRAAAGGTGVAAAHGRGGGVGAATEH
jgi:hypothetical protein